MFIAKELLKKISTFETITEICDEPGLIQSIKSKNIKKIYVEYTKRNKWPVSRKVMRNLERTALI